MWHIRHFFNFSFHSAVTLHASAVEVMINGADENAHSRTCTHTHTPTHILTLPENVTGIWSGIYASSSWKTFEIGRSPHCSWNAVRRGSKNGSSYLSLAILLLLLLLIIILINHNH